ncbi:hypothetical protein DV452_001612 [Geotrichum candidum]|nr:hypothetical protein DV452_001612 [Geotrichum candidum]KAI9213881.1 hypothetical protein DS838_001210 [Geotrichum bryndzae]
MKLQLWDTAGQERFRSLTRGYYRGSAGVLLVYDVTSRESFQALEEFIDDVRALTSPGVSIVVLGNKCDLVDSADPTTLVPESDVARFCMENGSGDRQYKELNTGTNSINFSGGDIAFLTTSALTGENVEEAFRLLAGMILTKIEMGVIDPENIESGVQYGEVPSWDRNSITRRGMSGTSFGSSGGSSKKPPQQHGRAAPAAPAAAGNGNSGSPADMLSLKKTVSHSAVPDAPFSPKGQSLFSSKFTVQEKNPQQRLITIHDLQDVSPLTSLPASDAGFDPSPQGASSFTDSRRPSYASQFTTSSIGSAGTTNNTPVGGSTEANSIYSSNSACNISSNANNTPASTDSGTRAKVNPISFPQPDDVFDNKEFQRFTQARSQSQTSESSNSNNNYNYSSNNNNNNNLSAKNVRTDSVDSSSVSTKKSKKSFLGKFISRRESSADFNERNKRLKPKNSEANLRTVSNASSFKIDLHNPLSHRPSAGFFTSHRDNNDKQEKMKLSRDYKHADMQNMDLQTIPVLFYSHCAEIEHLDVSENPSITIPSDFVQACTNLKSIRYVRNRAIQFPLNVLYACHLSYLDLSQNLISHLENIDFSKLSSLITLDLHGNKLSSIHESISDLKSLQCLNLSSNDLSEIHPSICSISTLRQLDFSFNRLHTIPEEIGKLVNLNDFAVNNNYIAKKLPDTFPNLVNLRDLDLRYNKLQSIDILSQLPNLEVLYCSKNSVSSFSAEFPKLKLLYFDRNPITKIELIPTLSTLTVLNLSKAKIVALQETFLEKIPFVEKLVLDKNHLSSLPPHIGSLKCLIYLSVVANNLDSVPPEIGLLHELRHLDLHNNNIQSLPEEIWNLSCLDHLNVSSNLLESFPKRPAQSSTSSSESERSKIFGDLVHNYELGSARRPSTLSISSSLGPNDRRMSAFPVNNRYSPAAFSPVGLRQRRTLANCLITLSLSDNRLTDECFEEISWLTELQVLNLSYNELVDIPYGALRQLHHLTELYLSGNNLTSLPADDLERIQSLRILHVNSNKLHSLPAELGKIRNLTCLDVGSNNLKYNINNWPYDWNWNYNLNLKYLNFSGNRRLEVKAQHNQSSHFGRDLPDKDLSDFTVLNSVRVLGLMDVTLITQTVPDQTENCRVRAYGSEINSMPYGLADSIGHNENLSVIDMVIERFRGKDNEVVIGLFDGRSDDALGGNKVSKLIQENFGSIFSQELKKLRENETVQDALRRAFLNTNKEIGNTSLLSSQELAHSSLAHRSSTAMSLDSHDGMTGSCATIVYIVENKMYVANSGDSMAIISRGSGEFSVLTTRHDPTAQDELGRIRQGGGVVSSTGQLDDILDVSRALGYYNLIPHIHATPSITEYDLADNDEILIIGSKHLWEYVSYQIALDVVRMSEGDFMRAAAKLRDFAIAYGASDKIMVMIIGVGISRRKSKSRIIGTSFGPMTSIGEEELFPAFKRKRDRSLLPEDSELARLGGEVDPPVNELAMVFTDIKNSTLLWETSPTAMRSAIKIHNSIMRRQLRIIGGYEVKTEGDAFMVSFPTPTSALLWSLSVQSLLLVADWPAEILECLEGGEILDENAEVIFRGLSVRMGIHWGSPVCEKDPITRRMDYFGPMVNRAARVSAVADGGQIALSFDFVAELKKLESAYNRYNSEESVTLAESFAGDEALGLAIEHDLKMLNNQGWVLKELGEEKLKGLENPEFISLAYQKSLLGRYKIHQERLELKRSASTKRYSAQQPSKIPQAYLDLVLQLRHITLRLERVCAKLSTFAMGQVEEEHNQRTSLFLGPGFHFTNEHDYAVMLNNLVTRIENCLSTVYLRATAQSIVMATNASAGDSTDGPITNNEAQLVANLLKLGPGSHGLSDILKALLNV